MDRILTLLSKELQQHGAVIAAVLAFLVMIGGLLLLGTEVGPRTITMLEAHASFVRIFLPLFGMALGHRLVVREYASPTHTFLTSLPIHRWEVLLTKYLLGLALVGFTAGSSLVVTGLVASLREPVTHAWLALVMVRTEVFAVALWSVLFALGLFGRWRFPLYLGLGLGLIFLGTSTDVALSRFWPFALVDETFVLERLAPPWGALAGTSALAAALVALGFWLGAGREGRLLEGLSAPMSLRQKAGIALGFAFALVILEVLDLERPPDAFVFESETVARHGRVSVLHGEGDAAEAALLAATLDDDLSRAADLLGLEALGPVFVAPRADLGPSEVEHEPLDEDEPGVLVRAAWPHPGFETARFRAFTLARAIEKATEGRARHEPRVWVLVGLSHHLVSADAPPEWSRRAAWLARQRAPRFGSLRQRQRLEERFGAPAADAWAWTAFEALAAEADALSLRAFVRDVLGPPAWPPVEVIATRIEPVEARMADHTGVHADALEAAWRARLAPLEAGLERMRAEVEVERDGGLRGVRARAIGGDEETCVLLHAALGPFDLPLEREALDREEAPCGQLDERVVLGRYGPGDRVFVGVERAALGGWLRLHASRRTVR
ncbi:MAG: ABC transporter permease [Sandaracinaceae bacterium]